jgi:hypothetical protein
MATTTNYGFEVPDDTDLVKDGAAAMRELGQDVDTQLFTALGGNYPGLRLVKKQTIGSAVASVNVPGAFSATYDAYKIIVSGGVSSANNTGINLSFGATIAGYVYSFGVFSNGFAAGSGSTSAASFLNIGECDTNKIMLSFETVNPNLAKHTLVNSPGGYNSANQNSRTAYYGVLPNTTQYTDFTITPSTGTFTGGTIYVYGYGAS